MSTADAELPPPFAGFEGIPRMRHPQLGVIAKVLPGFYYVTSQYECIDTTLGSCVSACVRDPEVGIGGLNHFMLPLGTAGGGGSWDVRRPSAANRFGNFAMESLINAILKLGGRRERLEVKLFGGGQVLDIASDVGACNVAFAREYLRAEGLRIVASDVGDYFPRKLIYHPLTGRVMVKKLRRLYMAAVSERERAYVERLTVAPMTGDTKLF